VAVSGGADSVALLTLLHNNRPEISPHIVHLNHQTRGHDSDADAAFVRALAQKFSLPHTIAQLSDIQPNLVRPPANASSRYRAARIELFRQTVIRHNLLGVIVAHHANDQAETVLLRLLRGSAPAGLTGMAPKAHLGSLLILRPLLAVDSQQLRAYLRTQNQPWREDASNASPKYLRNRLRPLLQKDPALRGALRALADACANLKDWMIANAPALPPEFPTAALATLPPTLARESARRWLISIGSPPGKLSEHVLTRLVQMASDAATPSRQHFPARLQIVRRGGMIFPVAEHKPSHDESN